MKKMMNAAYYDAVVSKSEAHARRWVEADRKDGMVILERRKENGKASRGTDGKKQQAKGLDMPKVRKSKRAASDNVQSQDGSASSKDGDSAKVKKGAKKDD